MNITKAKSAKEVGRIFPYTNTTNCYFEVFKDGTIQVISHNKSGGRETLKDVLKRIKGGESKLYTAWPGNYSTDLFIIDDLDAFAEAFGLEEGVKYSFTWEVSSAPCSRMSSWVNIHFAEPCDVDIYKINMDAFAEYLYNNLGWEVAKSKGSGGSQGSGGTRITVAVKGGVYPLKGSHNIE